MKRGTMVVWIGAGIFVLVSLYYFAIAKPAKEECKDILVPVKTTLESIEEWKEYRPQTDRFAVLLPSSPQHAAQVIPVSEGEGSIRYDMFVSRSHTGSTFMINVIEYPLGFDMTDNEGLLNGVVKEMVSTNPGNTLLKNERSSFLGKPAVEFVIQNQDAVIKTRVFCDGHTIFVLSTADNSQERAEANFKRIVDSFRLMQ